MKRFVLVLFLLVAFLPADAQRRVPRRPAGSPMYYMVEGKDTVFYDTIDPTWCFPRGKRMRSTDWRRYYKLVYNFNKVYPYALAGKRMMAQVDSTMAADITKRSQRSRYVADVEKELFGIMEGEVRHMTFTQGMVLMRLIDRECGLSGYEIIKFYENGFAAGFWQMVAKMFSGDLKVKYDPKGKDAQLEELCTIWASGKWDSFYYSIFMEKPHKTVVPERLQSKVR